MAAATYPLTIQDVMAKVDWLADDIMKQVPQKENIRTKEQPGNLGGTGSRNGKARAEETYTGLYPKCSVCNLHHPTTLLCSTCYLCNRLGHLAKNCHEETKLEAPVRVEDPRINRKACYECGSQSHLRVSCPNRKETPNQNRGNEHSHSQGWTYVINADGAPQEIPILGQNDEYADYGSNV